MSLLRHSARFMVLVCLLSIPVWGTGCAKKTKSKSESVKPDNDGKTDKPSDPMTTSVGKTTPKTGDNGKTGKTMGEGKTTPDPMPKSKTRKVNEVPPTKTKESGSTEKKRKLRKVGDPS